MNALELAGARRGDWMQTFTGRQFWPLDPRPEEVDPIDIAHALGHQCRYAGHVRRFYSVAEHCILMSLFMPTRELALAALLHDATEAYVVDVPRPLKRHLAGYAEIEAGVMVAIAQRFELPLEVYCEGEPDADAPIRWQWTMPALVKEADDRILLDERAQLMAAPPASWALDHLEPLGVGIDALPPHRAAEAYLARLESLGVTL